MNLEDIPTDEITPIIESCARDMARRYARYGADRADLSQEGFLWVYQHPTKALEYLGNDAHGLRQLARALRNAMHDYGEKVKAQELGYSLDDLYHYHKAEVRDLLAAVFNEDAWVNPPVSEGGPSGKRDPATGGGWIATLADVSQAFAKLGPEDRDLLHAFHRDAWTNKMMAEYHSVSEQTMSYRHDMAVKRLVDILGGPKPKVVHEDDCAHVWRGRHSVSNTHARAITETAYDDE